MSGPQPTHNSELLAQMAELLSAHGIDVSVLSEASIADRAAANADGSSSTGSMPVSGVASAPPPASTALLSSFPTALQHFRGNAGNRVPLEVPTWLRVSAVDTIA